MSQFVLCRVCLAQNIRMYPLHKTRYRELYEKFTGTKLFTGDGRLDNVCYICDTLLLRFYKFLQMSQKAEKYLTDMHNNGIELTANVSSLASEIQHFSIKTSSVSLINQPDTACASPVRTEPADCSSIQDITDPPVTSTIQDVAVKIESVDYDENDSYLTEEFNNHIDVVNDIYHVDVEDLHVDHVDVEDLHVDHADVENEDHVDVENLDVDVENDSLVPFDIKPITGIEIVVPKRAEIKISDVRVTLERLQIPKLRSKQRGHPCQSCPRRFRSAALLRKHKCQQALAPVYLQTLRHGPSQYHCDLCDRRFNHKSMFLVHHRTHTGEKPYQCKFCDRAFNDKSNCRKHMKKHLTSDHVCFMCERTFSERRLLVKHAVEHIL